MNETQTRERLAELLAQESRTKEEKREINTLSTAIGQFKAARKVVVAKDEVTPDEQVA